MGNATEAKEFLARMFAAALDTTPGGAVSLWTPNPKARFSRLTRDIDEAATAAADAAARIDAYYGLALMDAAALGPGRRGGVVNTLGISAFWCDLDIAEGGAPHKRPNPIPTVADAMALLERVGRPPTFTVRSGGGLHGYWLFDSPWTFDSPQDRRRAEQGAAGWVKLIQAHAEASGWHVDAVGDLARVLRVPGTLNHKFDPPKAVTLQPDMGPTYAADELMEWAATNLPGGLPRADPPQAPPIATEGRLILLADAQPDYAKTRMLEINDRTFRASLARKREFTDQSPSAYDMSIATTCAVAGWTDQEIVNLLLAQRRTHGDDLKLREDYYRGTLAKARAKVHATEEESEAFARLARHAANRGPAAAPGDTQTPPPASPGGPPKRPPGGPPGGPPGHPGAGPGPGPNKAAVLAELSKLFGFPIAGWLQCGRESHKAEYSIRLPDGREVMIGGSKHVFSQRFFQEAVLDSLQIVAPIFKPARWMEICKALTSVVEVQDVPDLGRTEKIIEWLRLYTRDRTVYRDKLWRQATDNKDPFVRDGRLYIYVGSLAKYLKISAMAEVKHDELYGYLTRIGFTREDVPCRGTDGRGHTWSYFAGPEAVLGIGDIDADMDGGQLLGDTVKADAGTPKSPLQKKKQ